MFKQYSFTNFSFFLVARVPMSMPFTTTMDTRNMTLQFFLLRALDLPWSLAVSLEAWRIGVVAGTLLFFTPLSMGPRVSPNVRIHLRIIPTPSRYIR
jgi:hypothetical protein